MGIGREALEGGGLYKKDQGIAAAGRAGCGENGGRELMPVGRFPSQASGQPPELVRDLKRGRASNGE